MKLYKAYLIILLILVIDQGFKIWVKTNMMLYQSEPITSWFSVYFVENEGMAFGMVLPGLMGKLFLSLFRLVAVFGGVWYLNKLVKERQHWGFVTSVAMILAGAIGNMIDGTFYGILFTDSHYRVAEMFPASGGYGQLLTGKVVDMLYFPLINGVFPQWVPFWGGEPFTFFNAIFNIADSAITVGVFIILLFQSTFFVNNELQTGAPAEVAVAKDSEATEVQSD